MAKKPQVDATTETPAEALPAAAEAIKIQGVMFPFTPRYAVGHVLSGEEALVLNQTLGENLRNNFATKMRAKQEEILKATPEGQPPRDFSEEELAAFQAEFATYQTTYTFKAPRQGAGPVDPILRECTRIAKVMLDAHLAAKGIKKASLGEGQYDAFVKRIIETKPEVREEAARRIEALKQSSGDLLSDLG